MTEKKHLADNMINFRKYTKISQGEFAKQTKLSRGIVSLIERQSSNVRLGNLIKIASFMGIAIPDVFKKDYVKNTFESIDE